MRNFKVTFNIHTNNSDSSATDVDVYFDEVNVATFISRTKKATKALSNIIEGATDTQNKAKHLLKMKLMKNIEDQYAFILNFKECTDLDLTFDEMQILCSPLEFLKYLYKF